MSWNRPLRVSVGSRGWSPRHVYSAFAEHREASGVEVHILPIQSTNLCGPVASVEEEVEESSISVRLLGLLCGSEKGVDLRRAKGLDVVSTGDGAGEYQTRIGSSLRDEPSEERAEIAVVGLDGAGWIACFRCGRPWRLPSVA